MSEDTPGSRLDAVLTARKPVVGSVLAMRESVLVATGLFLAGIPVGAVWWAPSMNASVSTTAETTDPALFAVNNLGVGLFLMAGVVLLGAPSVVGLLSNGMQIGGLVGDALASGVDPLTVAALILPHGVVELPALWLAGAVGLAVPWKFVLYVTERRDHILTLEELVDLLQVAALSLSLIVVAALLEAYFTPAVASAVGG